MKTIALDRAKELGLAHPDATDPAVLGDLFRGSSKQTFKTETPREIVTKLENDTPKKVNAMDIEDGSFVRVGDEWHKATAHEDGTTLKDGKVIELGQEEEIKARAIVAPDTMEHEFVAEKYRQQEKAAPAPEAPKPLTKQQQAYEAAKARKGQPLEPAVEAEPPKVDRSKHQRQGWPDSRRQ